MERRQREWEERGRRFLERSLRVQRQQEAWGAVGGVGADLSHATLSPFKND